MFDEIDTDSDGLLNPSELKAALVAVMVPHGDSTVSSMIRVADRDYDGLINFDEYLRVLEISAPSRPPQ